MAGIQDYLSLIKNAIYGKDVRQAIHDGIQQCYYDGKAGTTDLQARQRLDIVEPHLASIDTRIDEIIAPSGEAPSAAEVADGRIVDGVAYNLIGDAIRTINNNWKSVTSVTPISFTNNYYIKTNLSVGATVDLTPQSNNAFCYAIVPCQEGDEFTLNAYGWTLGRLWCFVDVNDKLISVSAGSLSVENLKLIAPANSAKCIINSYKSELGFCAKGKLAADMEREFNEFKADVDYLAYSKNQIAYSSSLGYIKTNVAVGETVDTTPVTSSGMVYLIQECNAGDRFMLTGSGGDASRLWAFTDGDYKLISKSANGAHADDLVLIAPEDGYLISNAMFTVSHSLYKLIPRPVQDEFDEIIESTIIEKDVSFTNWVPYHRIITNIDVGEVVDITPNSAIGFTCQVVSVTKGTVYVVTGYGGTVPRLWAFTDEDYKLISKSNAEAFGTHIELTAPDDGYLIVNAQVSNPMGHDVAEQTWVSTREKFADVDSGISEIKTELEDLHSEIGDFNKYSIPLVKFDIDHDLKDVSTFLSGVDFTDKNALIFEAYDLFDDLVTDYPDFVTKYDAALYDGLSMTYPRYANGVQSGDVEYLETSAYKTYLYKFSSISLGAGNARDCKKKKLFIVCGTHGSENASPFNAYIFAKMLCEATDENYFKLRDAFDVYIVPWLDGYCAQHTTTNPRVNANGVNINRNYPVEHWEKMNEGTPNYTGATAGSEFETQLIMALTEKINPDICIDHHNYFDGDQQFYTVIGSPKHLNLVYEALADCSFAFIHNLSEYFGTAYQLFVPNSDIESSPNRASGTNGTTCRWWYEHGIPIDATLEICSNIRFENGQPSNRRIDSYGNDAFSVAEYTLRNQLLIYSQWVMENMV